MECVERMAGLWLTWYTPDLRGKSHQHLPVFLVAAKCAVLAKQAVRGGSHQAGTFVTKGGDANNHSGGRFLSGESVASIGGNFCMSFQLTANKFCQHFRVHFPEIEFFGVCQ